VVWQLVEYPLQYLQIDALHKPVTPAVFAETSCERESGGAIGPRDCVANPDARFLTGLSSLRQGAMALSWIWRNISNAAVHGFDVPHIVRVSALIDWTAGAARFIAGTERLPLEPSDCLDRR